MYFLKKTTLIIILISLLWPINLIGGLKLEVKWAKLSKKQIQEYRNAGITDSVKMQILNKNKISPKLYKEYKKTGLADIYKIIKLKKNDILPPLADKYRKLKITDHMLMIDYKMKKITPEKIQMFKMYGFKKREVIAKLIHAKIPLKKAREYLKFGIKERSISALIKNKIPIAKAVRYQASGANSGSTIVRLIKAKIPPEQVRKFREIGIENDQDVIDAIGLGFTAKKIKKIISDYQLTNKDFLVPLLTIDPTLKEAKKYLKSGIKDSREIFRFVKKKAKMPFEKVARYFRYGIKEFQEIQKLISAKISPEKAHQYAMAGFKKAKDMVTLHKEDISPKKAKEYFQAEIDKATDVIKFIKENIKPKTAKKYRDAGIFNPGEIINMARRNFPIGSIPRIPEICKKTRKDKIWRCHILSNPLLKSYLSLFKNNCLTSSELLKKRGVKIPPCPKGGNFRGIPNTHPSAGIFAVYTGDNDTFLKQIHTSLQSQRKKKAHTVFNVVIPIYDSSGADRIKKFIDHFKGTELIKNINIIPVQTTKGHDRWMQDKMQFGTIKGKPALYHIGHHREKDYSVPLEKRIACQIGKHCNIPVVAPRKLITDPKSSSLASGGNWEVLPGGTIITGAIMTKGFKFHDNIRPISPHESKKILGPTFKSTILDNTHKGFSTTKDHLGQIKNLRKEGNNVAVLDTSFLRVGHVDEFMSVVKIKGKSPYDKHPCNYAILRASPKLGLNILRKQKLNKNQKKKKTCRKYSARKLLKKNKGKLIEQSEKKAIKKLGCFGVSGFTVHEILTDPMLVGHNNRVERIMEKNEQRIKTELKRTTKCQNPKTIDIPVLYDQSGGSLLPNSVNGVVQSLKDGGSTFLSPKSFHGPFDFHIKRKLKEFDVDTKHIQDLSYHIAHGEAHCGTNQAFVCDPHE